MNSGACVRVPRLRVQHTMSVTQRTAHDCKTIICCYTPHTNTIRNVSAMCIHWFCKKNYWSQLMPLFTVLLTTSISSLRISHGRRYDGGGRCGRDRQERRRAVQCERCHCALEVHVVAYMRISNHTLRSLSIRSVCDCCNIDPAVPLHFSPIYVISIYSLYSAHVVFSLAPFLLSVLSALSPDRTARSTSVARPPCTLRTCPPTRRCKSSSSI